MVFTVALFHCILVPLYTGSTVYRFHCIPVPLYTGFTVYRFHCIPLPLYTASTVYRFHCIPVPLYTTSNVYRLHLYTGYICIPVTSVEVEFLELCLITKLLNECTRHHTLHTSRERNRKVVAKKTECKTADVNAYSSVDFHGCLNLFSVFV